jgi:hypothetical protein
MDRKVTELKANVRQWKEKAEALEKDQDFFKR